MPPEDGTVLTKDDTAVSDAAKGTGEDTKSSILDTTQKPEEKKTDDTKGTDSTITKSVETVPEKYDFKVPKDSPLSEAEVSSTADIAKSLGLSQEKAQALLDMRVNDRAEYVQAQHDFLQSQVALWGEATSKDPEIAGKGGTEYGANIAAAKQVINKFATPEMVKALNQTGLGNHPELVRMLARIGKAMREDSFHTGAATKGSENSDPFQAAADKLYKSKEK
jgi:hypothetical protein